MSTRQPAIIVAGSINMDLVVCVDRFPVPGETVRSRRFVTVPGGKGANQAAAATLAGGSVGMIGRVGDDIFGSACLGNLRSRGVDVSGIRIDPDAPTGNAMIAVDAAGQNELIYTPGANGKVIPQDAEKAVDAISRADMVILQFELPMPTVCGVVDLAFRLGRKILINPAPAETPPPDLFQKVDYLIPNETEAELLTGINVTDPQSAMHAAEKLLQKGCRHVIVTLGSQGALVHDGTGATHVPAGKIEVVDATAAGDTFIGAFSVALAEGKSLVEAARFGCAAATLSVGKLGAQTSIPTRREIESFLKD
ncbi:MAG TPA: ribokinase [bacterium]|nr:ribokinase [bacterium]HQL61107.1 ribokinase [bacterium]